MTNAMTGRLTRFAAIVMGGSIALAGCTREEAGPVGVTEVQLAIVPGAQHGGAPYTTAMTQEVWHSPISYAGDADGTGTALITVNRGQREVCWQLTVSDILLPATLAHIHEAAPGVQGPARVTLTAPDASGTSSGCTTVASRDLLDAIVANPGAYYVNVHNATYPAGAVRGHLGR